MRLGRILTGAATVVAITLAAAGPAWACGGLVGENGTIQLVRTTTLAAYADGVQRYVTAFSFTGEGAEVGSIVPLPGVPTDVVRGGDWTLQRLVREVAPPVERSSAEQFAVSDADGAEVLIETEIDALDITVLRGDADEVGRWAVDNGFFLSPDAPEVLDAYAARSEVFMAARFDASRAAELGQGAGDSTPIMLTIPTDRPWVPLRILGLGADASTEIEADVFLLTPDEPQMLAGGSGLALERSEPASTLLLDDLRSDVGMEWVPTDMWLTYLQLGVEAGDLDYDLAVSVDPDIPPAIEDAGIAAPAPVPPGPSGDGSARAWWPLAAGLGAGLVALLALDGRRQRGRPAPSAPATVSTP
jgi:hypothetical protein